jgi:hypothetical protein
MEIKRMVVSVEEGVAVKLEPIQKWEPGLGE